MKLPTAELSLKASNKVEALCEQGCSQINELLDQAKKGKDLDILSDCNTNEVKQIIDELSQIMSIYTDD